MARASGSGDAAAAPAAVFDRIEVVRGDITRLDVDAIVNAANEAMAGGGGVDGAIHAAAGPELHVACQKLSFVAPGVRCATGDARVTPGFRLRARHVIHTVGPVWHGGQRGEPELLASCYRRSIELAREQGLSTLAFPAISTGIFGYPLEAASRVAIEALTRALGEAPSVARVTLVAFDEASGRKLSEALARAIVQAWLDASNAGDAERLIELSAPDIEIIGPRGSVRGREVLREWLERAGARFETRQVFSSGDRVVVAQRGVWHAPDGQVSEAEVAARFVVRDGRVECVQRYDRLDEALARAGLADSGG